MSLECRGLWRFAIVVLIRATYNLSSDSKYQGGGMAMAILFAVMVLSIFVAFGAAFAWLVCLASDQQDMEAHTEQHSAPF